MPDLIRHPGSEDSAIAMDVGSSAEDEVVHPTMLHFLKSILIFILNSNETMIEIRTILDSMKGDMPCLSMNIIATPALTNLISW